MWVRCISAGLAYAVSVFTVGFALGTVRVLVFVPRFGATTSVLLESPVILAVSWILSKVTTRWFHVRPDPMARGLMGGAALAVLMCLELAMSVLVFGRPASAFVPEYGTAPGLIGLAAQISPYFLSCRLADRRNREKG